MERWTFLRRLLSRFRHFSHHSGESLTNVQHGFITNQTAEYEHLWSNRFCVKDFHPKSLPQVNYDQILNGQVEDFSPDCWLDGHIHQFAGAADITPNQQFSSQEDVSSDSISSGSYSNTSSPRIGDSPRNILVDLFAPMYESSPPPYSDEPPPTYEEAMSSFFDLTESGSPEDDDNWIWY